jgi:hypothetical protein
MVVDDVAKSITLQEHHGPKTNVWMCSTLDELYDEMVLLPPRSPTVITSRRVPRAP